ncbi:aspartate carbamoyltransferase [Candidatus Micrarchaeota archaeon]|nr:aspartate carbamoyltransferase [Candidatus Micrarchaeota archaeon]
MLGRNSDLVSIKDVGTDEIESLFRKAQAFEENAEKSCRERILATLFFEASTRTRLSFESAMKRLGGEVISVSGIEGTSVMKGETFEDTIRMVENYCDAIVLRHPMNEAAALAASIANVPVINAGDGTNEHPTQTLLDLYTIQKEFRSIDGLKIAMIGDLKYGRTVHSLSLGLNNYDVSMRFISHPSLRVPDEIKREIKNKFEETEKMKLSDCDVIYMTRIQKERFPEQRAFEAVKGLYKISKETLRSLKEDSIILHPLPRVEEIEQGVDADKRAHYFQQARNGVFVRMAILDTFLNG